MYKPHTSLLCGNKQHFIVINYFCKHQELKLIQNMFAPITSRGSSLDTTQILIN